MQIDRSNYEIWMIDWLDGNLNSLQVEQLRLFLDQNPDLKEEFKDLTKANLTPSGISFPNKEHLKKFPSDILQSQFEYLCAAYLENDLSVVQEAELMEIVNSLPDKKKTFDLIQQTKLSPERIRYRYKNRLFKRTSVQKLIRLSVISLSTAAAISLIIFMYSVRQTETAKMINISARNLNSDTSLQRSSPVIAKDKPEGVTVTEPRKKNKDTNVASSCKEQIAITRTTTTVILTDDRFIRIIDDHEMAVKKVPVHTQVYLNEEIASDALIPSSQAFIIPLAVEERSKLGRFISKTFREKLLKEKTPPDSPLRGYEIAEAGVAGLNKLFGWQMAFNTKNDENGQPKSVSFNSGILKITAPVKKREAQP